MSPYLREALGYEDAGADVILAIDTTDALTPVFVEERLAAADNADIKNSKLGVKEIARIVSSLKGVMLGMTFGKQPYAKLKIDLGEDATPLADIVKPLVLGALANHGAMIDEMAQWKVEVKGTQVLLDGYLGESGLTRIASLINLPTHALQAPAASSGQSTAAAKTGGSTLASKPGAC